MKITAIFALASIGLLSGCATSVNTVQRAESQATPNYVNDQRVITDSTLGRALAIVAVNEATVSGDLLKIQVTLENTRRSTRSFNYRFEWIGQDGMEISSPGNSWRTLRMEGRETRAISAVAPSPRAVDFRLKLMEP